MTERKHALTDPAESLLQHLAVPRLREKMPLFFSGPDSIFVKAVESARGTEVIGKFAQITAEVRAWDEGGHFGSRWRLLQELAKFRAGPEYDLEGTLNAFAALTPPHDFLDQPLPDEETPFRPLLDTFFVTKEGRRRAVKWTPAIWQLLDFLAEWKGTELPVVRERTPILLANKSIGRVYFLVVERLPGPPGLVYPFWWKLGLMHLDRDEAFVQAVHKGLRAITNLHRGVRIRLRWWLERHPATETWFDQLEGSNSVEVAAACVATALFAPNPSEPRPLLDDTVAVSATLEEKVVQPPAADDYLIGAVDLMEKKVAAAAEAELSGVVFSSDAETPEEPGRQRNNHAPDVQFAATLADAYDRLLVNSAAVTAYKAGIVAEWKRQWQEEGTPTEFTPPEETTP
jgi:hypothetical protein